MIRLASLLLLTGVSLLQAGGLAQNAPPTSYVNPWIGTSPNPYVKEGYLWDTGNVFPGAVCPRGIVAWSPDTTHASQIAGGYWYPDEKIEDFSLTHFSGRGLPCLKDVAFLPVVQQVTSPGTGWKQYAAGFSHQNESAVPGYYRVKLDNGIETELTATPRTGMARFVFPLQSTASLLIRANGSITVAGNEVAGYATESIPSGGQNYKVYFVVQFSRPFTNAQTWVGDKIATVPSAEGSKSGAILSFDTSTNGTVMARAGISYTSLENARDNLGRENSAWDFPAVRKNADALWNHELGRVEIEGGTDADKRVFETALYHCFMHPNLLDDANGQFLGMDGKVHTVEKGHHQYQNIPAWDSHRSLGPLMSVVAADDWSDILQSLVNYAQEDASVRPALGGGLPRWQQANGNSGGMAGDGDDSLIATAYAFGVTQFDTQAALEAMDKDASRPGTTADGKAVREGLEEYMSLGYIPGRPSNTLEYCTDDFALAQFAKSLGDTQKYATYLSRAQNWRNVFDPATGYVRPRLKNGTWKEPFLPASGKEYTEGSAAQYTWLVNFNLRGLVALMGGNEKANERLDHFFTKTNAGMGSEFAFMGNEPCEETPWLYDFTSSPQRTQAVVRRIQKELFTTEPSGFPGNDDGGAISSWYVFSALGLYPEIPGVAGFVTGSPVFAKATLHLDNGKTIQILGEHAAPANCYVQGLRVNGAVYDSPWIPWSLLSKGGTIDFDLGPKPSHWGTDPGKAPPSFDSAR